MCGVDLLGRGGYDAGSLQVSGLLRPGQDTMTFAEAKAHHENALDALRQLEPQ
jgi:hypothetical protein